MGGILNQIKNKYAIEGRLTNRLGCPPYSLLNYDGRRFESELEKLSMGGGLVRIHLKNWKGGGSSFVRGEADPNNAASPDDGSLCSLNPLVGKSGSTHQLTTTSITTAVQDGSPTTSFTRTIK